MPVCRPGRGVLRPAHGLAVATGAGPGRKDEGEATFGAVAHEFAVEMGGGQRQHAARNAARRAVPAPVIDASGVVTCGDFHVLDVGREGLMVSCSRPNGG